MAAKTKPKGRKKGKLKQAKRSGATLKKKRSKGQSISRRSNSARTKKISRRPKKSIKSKPVPRKERSTVVESAPYSLAPTTTIYERQDEHDENGTIATSVSSSDGHNENDDDIDDNT